jgi:hypothetical protein
MTPGRILKMQSEAQSETQSEPVSGTQLGIQRVLGTRTEPASAVQRALERRRREEAKEGERRE